MKTKLLLSLVLMLNFFAFGQNIVVNGDFNNGLNSWSTFVANWIPVSANFSAANNEANITDITGAVGQPWFVQLNQVLTSGQIGSLVVGETYEITFDARSTVNGRSLKLFFGQDGGAFSVVHEQNYTLNNTNASYTATFTVGATYGAMKLGFEMGLSNDPVFIDNVVLQVSNVTPPPVAPNQPVGFVANSPTTSSMFMACGPNNVGGNIVYALYYSPTATAPIDPLDATEYIFGSTGGDGNGVSPFGFTLTGLQAATEYTFWLYQYNTVDQLFSTPAIVTNTTLGGGGTPSQPVGFVANSPTASSMFMACGPNNVDGNIVYALYYSPTATAPIDPLDATEYIFGSTGGDGNGVSPFGFTLTGLQPATEYTFWLYQYNTASQLFSIPAIAINTTLGGGSAPPQPVGFVVNSPTTSSAFLACGPNNVGGNISYALFYSPTAGAPVDPLDGTQYVFGSTGGDGNGVSPFGFILTGLEASTEYTFCLYQYNSVGELYSTPSCLNITTLAAPVVPTTNAPNPTCPVGDVVSIYGDFYATNIATNYNPNWGQSGFGFVNPNFDPGTGNEILAYPNFNYQGTDLITTNLSDMEFLNFDVFTNADPAATTLQVSPINQGTGPAEVLVTVPFVQGQWTSISLPKSAFGGMTWDAVFQMKFAANGPGSFVPIDLFLDNIFFSGDCQIDAPVNDQPCGALDITSSGQTDLNTYAFLADMTCNNSVGNNESTSPSVVGASCGGTSGRSMWYTFTTPSCDLNGMVPFEIEFSTNNAGTNFNTKLAIFESNDNDCDGVFTELACNDDHNGVGNPALCDAAGATTSTIVTSLQPNKQYWVYVDGFNAEFGDFVLSGRALTPAHGAIATGGGTQIQLSTTNMGAGLYTYYYKQVGSTGHSTSNSASALTNVRTLAPGNDYITQIMYRCGANAQQSQWYRTAPQTIALASTCAVVNDMTCAFNGENSYTLSWTQPMGDLYTDGGLSGYRIKRSPVGSAGVYTFSNPAVVCENGTCSVTLPGNNPTGFNWTIETRCTANNVQVGNTTSCGPQAPEFAGNNDASNSTSRTMQHTFSFLNAEAGIEFVDVQMHDAYADFGLNTPMIGDYEIYVNDNNEITWRRVDTAVDMNFDFVIVPNPSNAITTLHLSSIIETGSFTIVDAMGRTIQSGSIDNTDNINFDAAQLQSGVYMVVVTVGNMQMTKRLVVAN